MSRGEKRAAGEREMRVLVNRWARSGLPLSRFAEREGIGRKTLSRWRKRFGWVAIKSAAEDRRSQRSAESAARRGQRRCSPR